ncbi:hypothetical protein [Flexibacterium corallicola]|uniref:hypothetical protein n=1 Tax=Flexibacterium corallicola TaxID=3037259 RepID=UPI00286EC2F7|nr:hypothetical protein [Pseudovibrio sp. M1P-2-3]
MQLGIRRCTLNARVEAKLSLLSHSYSMLGVENALPSRKTTFEGSYFILPVMNERLSFL